MSLFQTKDIVKYFGASERTFYNYLKKIKFKKKSPGKLYNEEEVKEIASKLKFTIPNINGTGI